MKAKSTLLSNMKKATIEMLLLKLLAEGDMYGYQMSQELKKRSVGEYTILEGSMYPILYRLSDAKRISSYERKVGQRQTRVYYHIEEAGIEYLNKLRGEFDSYMGLIKFLLESGEGEHYEEGNKEEGQESDQADPKGDSTILSP